MKLRNQILQILEEHPRARDNDTYLTLKIWSTFYEKYCDKTDPKNPSVHFQDILTTLPREDNVKRIRAKIQNEEHKFLPTTIEVVRARKQNEDVWREVLGYNTRNL